MAELENPGEPEDDRINRRRVLIGIAAGGAAAWAAPAIVGVDKAFGQAAGTPPPSSSSTTGTTGTTQPPQPCNLQTTSGGEGVTTTVHELGATSGTFDFTYDAFSIPDQFDISYEGNVVFTTGGPVSGSATVPVTYGPGSATSVTVVVTGPSGTAWEYIVGCPT